MKLNVTHTEAKTVTVEIWKDVDDIVHVDTQECDVNNEDIDVELQPGQYLIIRGVE
jgi:hypothetical protein